MEVSVFAPATVANLGVGYDILGLAIEGVGDTVTARTVPGRGVRIVATSGDQGRLPRDPHTNTAGVAAQATLQKAGIDVGIELEIHKGLPIGSGLGSSAASAAAAAHAVNVAIGGPLRKVELVEPCMDAEAVVSGRHADNVAPSLLGGLVLVRQTDPLDLLRLPLPEGLTVVVVTPDFELPTREARGAVPEQVTLATMVHMTAQVGSLVSACYTGDLALLARSISDPVVGPARAALIPGCPQVISAALSAGALGSAISGAGPSIFALCHSSRAAHEVAQAMTGAFAEAGLTARAIVSPANCPGARTL